MINRNYQIECSEALKNLFYKYTHLPIGGKEIICPYWKNDLKNKIYGPLGGKGTPDEIVKVTQEEANKASVDLSTLSKNDTLSFMKEKRIGVDCSGFVFWMLDVLDCEKGGNGIADDIPNSQGRFIKARANVRMLTDKEVSIPVEVGDVRVGDMIKLRGGKHLSLIIATIRKSEGTGQLKEIGYAHSSCPSITQIGGVHSSKILVKDLSLGLKEQEWQELTISGENYGKACYLPELGDGIFRLKNFV